VDVLQSGLDGDLDGPSSRVIPGKLSTLLGMLPLAFWAIGRCILLVYGRQAYTDGVRRRLPEVASGVS
jgi:hypothetical protein